MKQDGKGQYARKRLIVKKFGKFKIRNFKIKLINTKIKY